MRKGPASMGSKPASRINSAATVLPLSSSPQYTRLGRVVLRLDPYTLNSASLGTVLKGETTLAFGTFFASSSAPDEVLAMMSFVLPTSIGSEQVTTTLPANRLPASAHRRFGTNAPLAVGRLHPWRPRLPCRRAHCL